MPTILQLPKKKKRNSNQRDEKAEDRVLRQQLYHTTKWRKCREAHLAKESVCQECLKEGKIYGGSKDDPIQVHHIISPFKDGKIDWDLALDDSNLETICSYHHGLEHKKKPEVTPEEIINDLDALLELTNDN